MKRFTINIALVLVILLFSCYVIIPQFNSYFFTFTDEIIDTAAASEKVNQNAAPSSVLKQFGERITSVPYNFLQITVSKTKELKQAIKKAHLNEGQTVIYLQDGEYHINKSIKITVDDVIFLSVSNNPYNVIIKGAGMKNTPRVQNIFEVRASGFV